MNVCTIMYVSEYAYYVYRPISESISGHFAAPLKSHKDAICHICLCLYSASLSVTIIPSSCMRCSGSHAVMEVSFILSFSSLLRFPPNRIFIVHPGFHVSTIMTAAKASDKDDADAAPYSTESTSSFLD